VRSFLNLPVYPLVKEKGKTKMKSYKNYLLAGTSALVLIAAIAVATPRKSQGQVGSIGSQKAFAEWQTQINCFPGNRPDYTEDPEGYFDWLDECTGDEPPEPPEPPLCQPGDRFTYTDASGKCWEMVCVGGFPEFSPCKNYGKAFKVFPRIQAIKLRKDGYAVLVMTRSGITEERVRHKQVRLVNLARAMFHGSRLPAQKIRAIPGGFWTSQQKIAKR